ncbi:MAG: 23S rRNA (guanosine(2251)-2'-O)-methyltransferase RlmB [Saprospiraceae bacterium]|nr:MAG: 23S rRNA (guanosine(2251)-2'-O)-methyltransferase RlmB [Saprospiraceae bacterium]
MQEKTQIIYGRHPVVDAIKSGATLDKLLLQQGIRGEFEKEIRHLCREYDIPLQVVPKERINRLVKGNPNHQGLVGMLSLIPYYKLEDVLPTIYERSEIPLIVLLDGITDVRNLGAIARSAECCGAHALVIAHKGSAQINAEAIKSSAGALTTLPVCREQSMTKAMSILAVAGIQVLAGSLKAEKLLHHLDLKVPLALVVGSEGDGISNAVAQDADELFKIPQKGITDSFNVSVAAGIMLYEVMQQRG